MNRSAFEGQTNYSFDSETGEVSRMHEQFNVVINEEEQYSIWPLVNPVPAGWRAVGVQGDREVCLAYIEEEWTDMRPRSLREWTE